MQVQGFTLNITSEDPDNMIAFYRDVVGLEPEQNMGAGAFKIGERATLIIDGHSDTKGKAKEPHRMLIDFFVEDIQKEMDRLKKQGVEFIRDKGKEYWGGVISTFADPDGNYVQLIEFKGE